MVQLAVCEIGIEIEIEVDHSLKISLNALIVCNDYIFCFVFSKIIAMISKLLTSYQKLSVLPFDPNSFSS